MAWLQHLHVVGGVQGGVLQVLDGLRNFRTLVLEGGEICTTIARPLARLLSRLSQLKELKGRLLVGEVDEDTLQFLSEC